MPRDSSRSTASQEQGKQPAIAPSARRDLAAIAAWVLGVSLVIIALYTVHVSAHGGPLSTAMQVVVHVGQIAAPIAAALGAVALLRGTCQRRVAWACLLGGIALAAWAWCGPVPEPVIVR
jgi:hypothetical protein